MHWNSHYALAGQHAFLSASKYSWLNYDIDKLEAVFMKSEAAAKGSKLHAFAHQAILLREKLPDSQRTLNMYVNDAIGFRMTPEQTLFYSVNAFGTPDAISYSDRKKILRISDLKTGENPTSEKQLLIYAAFFFLEYGLPLGITPNDVKVELRIYQSNECRLYLADPEDIMEIMDQIIRFDSWIEKRREEMAL